MLYWFEFIVFSTVLFSTLLLFPRVFEWFKGWLVARFSLRKQSDELDALPEKFEAALACGDEVMLEVLRKRERVLVSETNKLDWLGGALFVFKLMVYGFVLGSLAVFTGNRWLFIECLVLVLIVRWLWNKRFVTNK